MTEVASQPGRIQGLDGPSWGKAFVALLALCLSGGLHYTVIERFPDLPVGEVPDLGSYVSQKTVRVQDIQRSRSEAWERPEAYEAQDPARTMDVMASVSGSLAQFAPTLAEPEPLQAVELAGEAGALAEPDQTVERSRWEPRLAVMQIEKEIYSREVTETPRRYAAPNADLLEAPRLADMHAELAASDILARLESSKRATGLGVPIDLAANEVREGLPLPEVLFSDGLVEAPIPGMHHAEEELGLQPEEAAPFASVEDLLTLQLSTFRPSDEPTTTYFQVEIRRKSATEMPVLPKDVLIIQDCSESMTQRKLNACKEGLRALVADLGEDDRIDVMGFREDTYRCFDQFRFATPSVKAQANLFIEEMEARGRTDVLASLEALSSLGADSMRPLLVVLVTDGRPTAGMVDSSDIIEAFTRSNRGQVSVFAVGGGRRVNRFLLDLLSYRNRGDAQVVEKTARIPAALDALSAELGRPVLRNLAVRFSGVEESEVYPKTLTHLYLDRPLVMYGRIAGAEPESAFQIVGRSQSGAKDMVFPVDWGVCEAGDSSIRSSWAWHKIYHLIGEYIETDRKEVMDEIHRLADQFGLKVPYGRDVIFF